MTTAVTNKAGGFSISPVGIAARQKLDIRPGDTVRVSQKIQEKGKTRLQAFEGLVLARKHGKEPGATFTVRKVASGVGVEKIFPLYSPMIEKVEILKRSKVRRAKLYYIRDKVAKEIRRQMRNIRLVRDAAPDPEEAAEDAAIEAELATQNAAEDTVLNTAPEAVETTEAMDEATETAAAIEAAEKEMKKEEEAAK